jgi:Protein of unknown function (DUF2726)
MEAWTIGFGFVLLLLAWRTFPLGFSLLKRHSADEAASLPYRKRDCLLSGPERALFETLLKVAGERYHVVPKVRLADVVWLPKLTSNRWLHWNRIAQKHLDFVLCDRKYLEPLLVVELESSTTRSGHAEERTEFVGAVLTAAGVPLLRLPLKRTYSPQEVGEIVDRRIAAAEPLQRPRPVLSLIDGAVPNESWIWGAPKPVIGER